MSFDVASAMVRLLLAPIAGTAFLSFKTNLYLISSISTAYRLMPFAPLILIDARGDNNPLKKAHGVAELLLTDEMKAVVRLLVDNSAQTIELRAEDFLGPTGDWIYGAYFDKWVATEAEIEISDASQAVFEFYLPPRGAAAGKGISIAWDGGEMQVEVPRDAVVTHPPIRLEGGRQRIRISSQTSEHHDNSADLRFLGVLVAAMILDNRRIQPWVHEGVSPLAARQAKEAA